MDLQRAREIIKSDAEFEVLHQGSPVWIEELDTDKKTANVKSTISDSGRMVEVPIDELIES